MFDGHPFETGGDIQKNNHQGKMAEEEARTVIRNWYGEPEKIADNKDGWDFRAYNEFEQQWYEIEVKSGNAQLTEAQEEWREQMSDGTISVVIRITQPII